MMSLIIDADGCPVRKQAVSIARKNGMPAVIVSDISHRINDSYAKVITVDKGFDAADFKIMGLMKKGDIIVTQDYGLASLVLSKGGYALDQNGKFYTEDNIDMLLLNRHISKQVRKSGKRTKGPAKRKASDDEHFIEALEKFIKELKK